MAEAETIWIEKGLLDLFPPVFHPVFRPLGQRGRSQAYCGEAPQQIAA